MIAGIFHEGSGLGNQLFRYITLRTLAQGKNYEWGMYTSFNFKGKSLFDLDMGKFPNIEEMTLWKEKKVVENGIDIRGYDPEINFVTDETVIDGEFQDDKYWRYNLSEIDKWLYVEPLEVPDDLCIIGFRGGEYYSDENLGLPQSYYLKGIEMMQRINPNMKFEVHTDDELMAKHFFPTLLVIENKKLSHSNHSNMGYNWRAMRYAKYAIIANSSFYILPRILSKGLTIAPRYWARHNTKIWALPSNYYPEFTYV